jgi:hypothetical protein
MENGELGETADVLATGQRHNTIGSRIAADQVESAFADGTCGTENGNTARPDGASLNLNGDRRQ